MSFEVVHEECVPRWRPYPRWADRTQRYGYVQCKFCFKLLDYGLLQRDVQRVT